MYADGTIQLDPEFKAWGGVGGCHRIDSMQAASCEVEGGAGGPGR